MRKRYIYLLLFLLLTGCARENLVVKEVEPLHPYWPLQKYAKWVYSAGGSFRQEIILGPQNDSTPAYFPFQKAPFPAFKGLRLNENGDLELLWKYYQVTTVGILLPHKLPADTMSWHSVATYFYRIHPQAGIAIQDSVRFLVKYGGLIPRFTPSPSNEISYEWVVDLTIRTEIWHIFEERWMEDEIPEYRLFLDEQVGPVVFRSPIVNRHLIEAVER